MFSDDVSFTCRHSPNKCIQFLFPPTIQSLSAGVGLAHLQHAPTRTLTQPQELAAELSAAQYASASGLAHTVGAIGFGNTLRAASTTPTAGLSGSRPGTSASGTMRSHGSASASASAPVSLSSSPVGGLSGNGHQHSRSQRPSPQSPQSMPPLPSGHAHPHIRTLADFPNFAGGSMHGNGNGNGDGDDMRSESDGSFASAQSRLLKPRTATGA